MKLGTFAVIGALCAATITGANARDLQLSIAGASPGGLWSLIGVGIDRAAKAADPKSTITYQTSGGGFANIAMINAEKVELGIAHNAELRRAVLGTDPFKQPIASMRAIANIYNWAPMQVVATKEFVEKHGVKTVEDLVTKKLPMRLTVNRRGNITEGVAETMLKHAGATMENIESWGGKVIFAGSQEQSDLITDGRVDVYINGVFAPLNSIVEVSKHRDLVILPLSKAVIDKVAEEEGLIPYVIPAGTYEFQKDEIPTIALGAMIVASEKMSADTAYSLAKAITENLGELTGAHKSLSPLTKEFLAGQNVVPYHPGAVKYYTEQGFMK